MRVHLEFDCCPVCQSEVEIPGVPRFDHWRQAHLEITDLTIHQVSWILDRSVGKDQFVEIYPFDYRSPDGTRYWKVETVRRYIGSS
jgi:hypothetical protein